ncbi:MAG: hypothetical protein ACOYMG_29670 [Candidatus Methylumidiphilus sp.]
MTDDTKDLGVAIALMERFTEDTLPKALEIKKRLDEGGLLDHWDIEFLEELFKRAEEIRPLIDRHPEYQEIYAGAVHLYKQIADEAMQNENISPSSE